MSSHSSTAPRTKSQPAPRPHRSAPGLLVFSVLFMPPALVGTSLPPPSVKLTTKCPVSCTNCRVRSLTYGSPTRDAYAITSGPASRASQCAPAPSGMSSSGIPVRSSHAKCSLTMACTPGVATIVTVLPRTGSHSSTKLSFGSRRLPSLSTIAACTRTASHRWSISCTMRRLRSKSASNVCSGDLEYACGSMCCGTTLSTPTVQR
mmetsp:Transcript_13679/g.47256  ORF Transcript_13679/g.47256 Transcript_13679/m.47256 type:complete len:205 (+) Transcript_13679:1731-2345(+)